MRRELLRAARMKVPHHVERGEKGVVVFPGSERESAENDRRHAAYAGIALDDLAEIVGAVIGDSRFGFGNQGLQAFPADRALDCGNLVFSSILCSEHGFGKARADASRVLARSTTLSL